jgi:hypothetical protein
MLALVGAGREDHRSSGDRSVGRFELEASAGPALKRHPDAPGSADFTTGGLTSTGRGAKVTAEFIISEVCKGEDVELVYRFPRGGAHIVNVTGAGRVLGVPWITYVHDHVQTSAADPRDTTGTGQTDFSFLADTDRDGRLNLASEATVPNASYVTTESTREAAGLSAQPGRALPAVLSARWAAARRLSTSPPRVFEHELPEHHGPTAGT